jgi:hypothetical protein
MDDCTHDNYPPTVYEDFNDVMKFNLLHNCSAQLPLQVTHENLTEAGPLSQPPALKSTIFCTLFPLDNRSPAIEDVYYIDALSGCRDF